MIMTPKPQRKPKCSICKKPVSKTGNDFFPFCSEQCRLIDLGKWLDGRYAVPGSDSPSSPDDDNPDSPNGEG
jgi:endogenous inhibitor of DNA gyrase (YacG/DUF329 family)